MEVIAAAGLCAPGCGAVVSALAGGPVLGVVSLAAAVGYGLYSTMSKEKDGDRFQDAIEGESGAEEPPFSIQAVVKVAKRDPAAAGEESNKYISSEGSLSFL